ncbi:MAG: NUDIX domain-containing protein [Nanoarchaeota archaeon]|nr:NUDIX domain-containing protein [Nanoarchaeota archaeon]
MVLKIYLTKGLVRCGGKYLLLKKLKDMVPENSGKWECPGGKIKETEDPEKALLREIKEETGLECKIVKELPLLHMENEKYDSTCHVYLVESRVTNVKLSDEHSEYRWVSPKEVKNMDLVMFAGLLLEYFNKVREYEL